MDLRDILGIKYPIIQGGMANIATGEFAAAVSNAGGLGLIASGGSGREELRAQIRAAKARTDKLFGVNLMLMNPNIDDLADLVVEEGVRLVTTGAGSPGKYMDAWNSAGILVFPVVQGASLAKRMEQYGAAGVIAEGTEAGGHIGETTTMALIPQVCDAVSIPVVAAGGIADGRQMLAAFALGARGVQLGTAFLASVECPIHENYKNAIVRAKDHDTVVTGRGSGAPVRVIRNGMTRDYLKLEKEGASLEELERFTVGSLRRAVKDGDVASGSLMAGQVAGMVREIKCVADIMRDMMEGFERARKALAGGQG